MALSSQISKIKIYDGISKFLPNYPVIIDSLQGAQEETAK